MKHSILEGEIEENDEEEEEEEELVEKDFSS